MSKTKTSYWRLPGTWVSLVLLVTASFLFNVSDYSDGKLRSCTVVDKVVQGGESANFWLILRDEQSRVFNLIVSPATYSQAKIGENITFNLREYDIEQTTGENILFIVLPLVLFLFSICGAFLSYHYYLTQNEDKQYY